jgi:hypothetical protein
MEANGVGNNGNKKRVIILCSFILVLAVFIAVVPVIVARYMRIIKKPIPKAEFMLRIKGVVKQAKNIEKTLYIKGDNGLIYALSGAKEKTEALYENLNKHAVVFGNIMSSLGKDGKLKKETLDGEVVRMFVEVDNFEAD